MRRGLGLESDANGVVIDVEILRVEPNGGVKGGVGFRQVSGLGVGGGDEAEDAYVFGQEFSSGFQVGKRFAGAALLAKKLTEEEEVVALGKFVDLQEGFAESGAEVVNGEFRAGALNELLGGALGC